MGCEDPSGSKEVSNENSNTTGTTIKRQQGTTGKKEQQGNDEKIKNNSTRQ